MENGSPLVFESWHPEALLSCGVTSEPGMVDTFHEAKEGFDQKTERKG